MWKQIISLTYKEFLQTSMKTMISLEKNDKWHVQAINNKTLISNEQMQNILTGNKNNTN